MTKGFLLLKMEQTLNKSHKGEKFMIENKNLIILFIILALALMLVIGGMVYELWGPF